MIKDVKELSESTQNELGGDNVMFAVAFDSQGKQTVFQGRQVTASEVTFPETVMQVDRIDAMSVVSVTRNPSNCCVWVSGGKQYSFCW
ncbi:MAG: hypothetical protein ACREV0_03230 [Burkholderiales bacterium]|jgi:hypothetical protein